MGIILIHSISGLPKSRLRIEKTNKDKLKSEKFRSIDHPKTPSQTGTHQHTEPR